MDRAVYRAMADQDAVHWWYRARRRVLAAIIAREIDLPPGARILEIGCGTGHNLAMLARFGQVDAVELDDEARAIAERRLGQTVAKARLPELEEIERGAYDLVALLDVIEHVEADVEALRSVATLLRPGGQILIAVPAHQWMWSGHDEANHHFRRYSATGLRKAIEAAGLGVTMLSPMNSLLFPLAVAARFAGKLTGRTGSDDKVPPAPVNRLFDAIFGLEAQLVGRLPMPPSLSLVAIAAFAT